MGTTPLQPPYSGSNSNFAEFRKIEAGSGLWNVAPQWLGKVGGRGSDTPGHSCRFMREKFMAQDQQPPSIDELRAQVSQMLDSLPSQVPIAAIVLFKVNPQKEAAFLDNANALTFATRRLPGCNVFAFHKSVNTVPPSQGIEYLIYEDWQTRDLFRTQWNSSHLQRFQHSVGELIVAPPDLRFYYGWQEYRTDISSQTSHSSNDASESPQGSSYSSIFSFPYAMSLFGLQQMANVFSPQDAARSMERITRATEQELSNPLRSVFRMGDAIQRAAFDITLGAFGGRSDRGRRSWSGMADDVAQRTASTVAGMASSNTFTAATPPRSTQASPPMQAVSSQPQSAAGWGPMPYPVPSPDPPQSAGQRNAAAAPSSGITTESNISADYPFAPHYVNVLGSRMHYIEQGTGDPILLLHGNPSWSYIWRNIIPHLSPLGRCIAPDLIGFGRSGKPEIEYLWRDHVRYVETFIEAMGLRDVTLVLHDQGSGIGFHYAMHNQENIKAIAFFEAIVRPYPWDKFSTPEFREIFRRFRTGGVGGEGWKLIVDQNMFIEQLLPQAAGRQLTDTEMNFYREPFRTPESRIPIWRFPRQTPIGGEPEDVWDAVSEYSERLQQSEIPKLMLYATPGALLTQEHVQWCQQNINNLQSVFLGPGLHFLQESSPHRIGREIAKWIRTLPV